MAEGKRRAGSQALTNLSLSALLSQALVAFTVEADNEFEHRTPHRTTRYGSAGGARGPWLASMAMYWTCMRFVGEEGVRAGELQRLARTKTNLNGMIRWGYVTVAPDPADPRPKPPKAAWLIRATAKGLLARAVWAPLPAEIEERWEQRFGKDRVERLRTALHELVRQFDIALPDCMPILGYGLFSAPPDREVARGEDDALPLCVLLSRALLAIAIKFEEKTELSLAISADVIRVLNEEGVRLRDLPLLSGVSKESIAVALGILRKGRLVAVESAPGDRGQTVRLTGKGIEAQERYQQLTRAIEARLDERFAGAAGRLRAALEPLVGDGTAEGSPLFAGLKPYPEGWRAKVPTPATLPHFPMTLHRGGYPDGS